MEVEGAEVLQLLIPNFNLKDIIKEPFLKDIEEKYDGNVRVVSLNIIVGNENSEMITLAHLTPSYEKENKLVLDVKSSESINTMFDIIKNHQNEG